MRPNPHDAIACGLAWWLPKVEAWRVELQQCADPDRVDVLNAKLAKAENIIGRLWNAQRERKANAKD